jgi:hypothetical protein
LIVLWDVVFGVWQIGARDRADAALTRIRPAAALGFALSAAWMPIFSMQIFWLALIVIWASLACLAFCAVTLSRDRAPLPARRWCAWMPLSLHAGWLSLAVFLNTAQVIVAYRLLDVGAMLPWSLALFAAAAAVLLALNAWMRGNAGFVAAALWGLIAVSVKQSQATLQGAEVAAWVAIAIATALLVQSAWIWARRRHPRLAAGARAVDPRPA